MYHSLNRVLAACVGAALPAVVQAQQAATISGRVTSDAGQPLPGVSVFLPTLNFGTTTSADGAYTFTVPAARATGTVTITARRLGFRSQSFQITLSGGQLSQNFVLPTAPTTLTEVVVTGAGTVSTRERLGNVINSVDSASIQRAATPQNVVSALAGKAPNVVVQTQSGEPGASASIKIRGATSVQGTNQPLFVVDGQPIDNTTLSTNGGNQSTVTQNRAADINPNDIESIQILKSAAAAAIYGARAANGVVLITTKRGRAGQTSYTLNSTNTFDRIQNRDLLQRSYGQGSGGEASTCNGFNCRPTSRTAFGPAIGSGQSFDHIGDIFDTGQTYDENLQVSGGNDRTLFFVSGGLTRQKGFIVGPNNFQNRSTVRLKASHRLFNALTVGGNFNYIDNRGGYVQKGSNTSGLLLGSLRTPPDFDNRQYLDARTGLHRSYRFPNPDSSSLTTSRGYDNPFFVLNSPANRGELGRFVGNLNVDWQPLSWLRVQETLGADNYSDDRREALPLTSSSDPVGNVTRFTQTNLEIDHNLLATANYNVNPNWSGTVSLGQNLNSRRYRSVFVFGDVLNAPEPLNLQNTLSYTPTEFRSLRHIAGYFAQGTADLYNQLYLTALIRNDGYSTFGSSKRFARFPSASAAWTFSNLLGRQDQKGVFSYGKLRFGYGEAGREPPVYGTITAFSTGQNVFGSGFGDFINASQGGQAGLIYGAQLGNNSLKPERSIEREFGTDLGFLDQRLTLGLTYYNKRSSDVILALPINAGQTGATLALRNAATITNKGAEVELNARIVQTKLVSFDLAAQFGRNRGKVVSLAEGTEFVPYVTEGFTGAIGSSTVGYAPGVIRGLDFARCGRGLTVDGVDIDAGCGTGYKKDALYLSADGLPVVDPTDRVIADPNPKYTMGFSPSLRISRVTLSGFLDVRRGGEVWNGTRGILYFFGTHKDTDIRSQQGGYGINWETDRYPDVAGPGKGVTAFKTPDDWENWWSGEGGGFGTTSGQFIESASFVKLRELSVAYNADQPWVRRALGVSNVNLRLSGRNLKLWSKYKGFDPEANLGGAEFLTQGIDYFNNPLTRSFVLAVTVNR